MYADLIPTLCEVEMLFQIDPWLKKTAGKISAAIYITLSRIKDK